MTLPHNRTRPVWKDQPPHVLVVDDETALQAVTCTLLGALGCSTASAGDAEGGLAAAGDPRCPDLAILDLTLEGSDRVRDALADRGVPVVLSTGAVSVDLDRQFPDHPRHLRLWKPYGLQELGNLLVVALPEMVQPAPGRGSERRSAEG